MCLFPQQIYVTHPNSGIREQVTVGCGKCSECMQQRTSNWRARLMMEASTNGCYAFMVTFTYDDSHLPIVSGNLSTNHYFRSYDPKNQYSVYYHKDFWTDEVYVDYPVQCKKDIQNFNKRLRITIQRQNLDIKYRYFIVAEYGPKTYRPLTMVYSLYMDTTGRNSIKI